MVALRIERSAEMRYGEQIFEIDVPLDAIDWTAPDLVARIHEEFHRGHEELYTYASRDQEVVFVNARAAAVRRRRRGRARSSRSAGRGDAKA